jgi:hypothetical protein
MHELVYRVSYVAAFCWCLLLQQVCEGRVGLQAVLAHAHASPPALVNALAGSGLLHVMS